MSVWWWQTKSTAEVAAMKAEIFRYSTVPPESFTTLEEFMAGDDAKVPAPDDLPTTPDEPELVIETEPDSPEQENQP